MQAEDGSLNEAALNEEISLKLAEEIVKDPARITKAVEQDRGLIGKLLDFVRGLKNQTMIRFGKSESAMLDEAERTLVNLLRRARCENRGREVQHPAGCGWKAVCRDR